VARTSPPDRLRAIVEAATAVFLAKGYKRTLMTDVAAALELSPGALYNHVESKEALFHLCLLPTDDLPRTPPPFRTPPLEETIEALRQELKGSASLPRLRRALRDPAADAVKELGEILQELYERVERHHVMVALIERSCYDIPELAEVFYTRGRQRSTDRLAEYLQSRVDDGSLRAIADPATAAVLLREGVSWFAYHRHFDPIGFDADDVRLSGTVIDLLLHGIAP
jgi:AcrR family transcriptional regulator